MSALTYRPEIDGLRAIAVMTVVAYHANLPGISGGFIGVDVFFVISGFLITSIIAKEIDRGDFSILRFYERRARRILPALFAVIFFVCALGPLVLLPNEFAELPDQILGALLFVANIVFWTKTNYFSNAAESNLLLHTWSLGVEEQFYILVPLLLIVVSYLGTMIRGAATALAVAISFALCVYLTPRDPTGSFYLLHTRAWELGVGSMLALGLVPAVESRAVREALAVLGLGLIAGAACLFTSKMTFPGYAALAPVLGAALILHAAPGTKVGAVLSTRAIVGVGLISYSLYLWHWPIFVAADMTGLMTDWWRSLAFVALAMGAGWLSWRFVERPFRSPQTMPARRIWFASAGGAAALSAAALGFMGLGGWPQRYDPATLAFVDALYDVSPLRDKCHVGRGLKPVQEFCFMGDEQEGEPPMVVWADSHGVELSYALSRASRVHSITYSSCPPAIGFVREERPDCVAHNAQVLRFLQAKREPVRVVLAGYWANWLGREGFRDKFRKTLSALEETGHTIVLVGPTPGPSESLPKMLARGAPSSMERAANKKETPEIRDWMTRIEAETSVTVVRPATQLCSQTRCSTLIEGSPIFFDDNHPSQAMANQTAKQVEAALEIAGT